MSKRTIVSVSVIGILIILIIWAYSVSSKMTDNLQQPVTNDSSLSDERVNVEDFIITETRYGQKFWEIYATSGHYDNVKNLALLTNIKGNFYKRGKVVLSFDAPLATYNERTKEVKLTNGARAATDDRVFISAKDLSWIGNTDQITASGNVRIKKDKDLATVSDISIFNTDFTRLKLIGNSQTYVYKK